MKSPSECELHTPYGVEISGNTGPTGCFRAVLEIAVHDYGSNELWRGKPGDEPKYRVPTQLVATQLGMWIAGADTLCDYDVSETATS